MSESDFIRPSISYNNAGCNLIGQQHMDTHRCMQSHPHPNLSTSKGDLRKTTIKFRIKV